MNSIILASLFTTVHRLSIPSQYIVRNTVTFGQPLTRFFLNCLLAEPHSNGYNQLDATSPMSLNPNLDLSSMRERLRAKGLPLPLRYDSLQEDSPAATSPNARRQFEFVQYKEVDTNQKEEFEELLKKV